MPIENRFEVLQYCHWQEPELSDFVVALRRRFLEAFPHQTFSPYEENQFNLGLGYFALHDGNVSGARIWNTDDVLFGVYEVHARPEHDKFFRYEDVVSRADDGSRIPFLVDQAFNTLGRPVNSVFVFVDVSTGYPGLVDVEAFFEDRKAEGFPIKNITCLIDESVVMAEVDSAYFQANKSDVRVETFPVSALVSQYVRREK